MIEIIPLEYYSKVFYNILLFLVLLTFLQAANSDLDNKENLATKNLLGIISFVIIVLYMGLRPISGEFFSDMLQYARQFSDYQNGIPVAPSSDILFAYFIKVCSAIMPIGIFFLLCALLYCYPMYVLSKAYFKEYWFYCFLMFAATFTFWGAGTNGIRNGLATSLFLLALSKEKKYTMYIWMIASILVHQSLTLPVAAFFVTRYYNNTRNYLYFWLLAIPLSLVLGSFFEGIFLNLGFGQDDRLQGYLTELDEGIKTSKSGFRWDFLLYSFTGVFSGWYFIIRKKFSDVLYSHLFNMYLLANAFWILIIRANFSNRFAYLSWFLLAVVILYPMLKMKFFVNQHEVVAKTILVFFMFAYVLNVILI